MPFTIRCPQCRHNFTADYSGRVHCSPACRGLAQRARHHGTCEHCAAPFSVPLSIARKGAPRFCSRACYEAGRSRVDIATRFWSKVDKRGPDDCWLWTASLNTHGYGRMGETDVAHRVAYRLAHGRIPRGKQVNHTCDVRACVNPAHLYAGTAKENTRDAIARGRWRSPFVK